MKTTGRSLDSLVEEQLKKWNVRKQGKKIEKVRVKPCLALSREPGCGGSEIARRLSINLEMDIIGGGIIQKVAESAEMSEIVIKSLDEKEITKRDDWLTSLFETRHLWPEKYLFHLTKVIGTIGRHGNALIVGRGAHCILPPEETFRVRIIAPLTFRIAHMMAEHKLSRKEAEQYIAKTESDRCAFIRKYFHVDLTDPSLYDLILNASVFTVDGAVDILQGSFHRWQEAKRKD
jgi:cytidylate kinase